MLMKWRPPPYHLLKKGTMTSSAPAHVSARTQSEHLLLNPLSIPSLSVEDTTPEPGEGVAMSGVRSSSSGVTSFSAAEQKKLMFQAVRSPSPTACHAGWVISLQ